MRCLAGLLSFMDRMSGGCRTVEVDGMLSMPGSHNNAFVVIPAQAGIQGATARC